LAHRQIAFCREVVCDENVVAIEFDVPVADRIALDLGDGRAVDEIADGDEHFATEVNAYRMAGREVQVL
jgi:hypothetical protein